MNLLKISVLLVVSCFVYACAAGESQNVVTNSVSNSATPVAVQTATATPVVLASGHDLYVDNCAKCHKEDGTGGKMEIEGRTIKPDNLTTDKMKRMPDEKMAGYIRDGIEDEGMPAFKDKLNDAQIASVIQYIRTDLQKK